MRLNTLYDSHQSATVATASTAESVYVNIACCPSAHGVKPPAGYKEDIPERPITTKKSKIVTMTYW